MARTALYPGSFDPVTNGHLDVVRHAVGLCDRLVVAIGVHPGKTPLFSADERLAMITETCAEMVRSLGCTFEAMTFNDLAVAIADLAERARTKKLKPEEASGSTFTLTNSGVFGGEYGTPIINQPESAILAIGGLRKEPVVLTDAEGNDTIAIRSMQQYCLGFDHRTIDGSDSLDAPHRRFAAAARPGARSENLGGPGHRWRISGPCGCLCAIWDGWARSY